MTNRELAKQFRQRCLDAGVSDEALRLLSRIDADDLARIEMEINGERSWEEERELWRLKDYRAKKSIGLIKDD